MSFQIIHPYVTQVEGVAGGKPVIRGTRTPVRSIVAYHRMGNTPEEIIERALLVFEKAVESTKVGSS